MHNFKLIPFFQILKKAYSQILKNLTQFFCSSLFQILKKHTYKFKKTWRNFFLIPSFQILQKVYVQILKNLMPFFFSSLFQILKKANLQIPKNLTQLLCSSLSSNIKKIILTNPKKPNTIFLLIPFFKYEKKHIYKS